VVGLPVGGSTAEGARVRSPGPVKGDIGADASMSLDKVVKVDAAESVSVED
jgi:hypothetical protein